MPIYRGGLTGLAGTLSGIEEGGGRVINELTQSHLYNKEMAERQKKEQKDESVSRINIAMEVMSKANTPEDHKNAVDIYNSLKPDWERLMGKDRPMPSFSFSDIVNINSIVNNPEHPDSIEAYKKMSISDKIKIEELIANRMKIKAEREEKEAINAAKQREEQENIRAALAYKDMGGLPQRLKTTADANRSMSIVPDIPVGGTGEAYSTLTPEEMKNWSLAQTEEGREKLYEAKTEPKQPSDYTTYLSQAEMINIKKEAADAGIDIKEKSLTRAEAKGIIEAINRVMEGRSVKVTKKPMVDAFGRQMFDKFGNLMYETIEESKIIKKVLPEKPTLPNPTKEKGSYNEWSEKVGIGKK